MDTNELSEEFYGITSEEYEEKMHFLQEMMELQLQIMLLTGVID